MTDSAAKVEHSKKAKKPNYNRLAKCKRQWDEEAKKVIHQLSESQYAAPKVEAKLYIYEEIEVWL